MNECCENCRFWFRQGAKGLCRRYPPNSKIGIKKMSPMRDTIERPFFLQSRPMMQPDDWCGEWHGEAVAS